jgi:plasmid maintenance system antidote protein VapI
MKQKPVREVVAANLQQLIGYDPSTGRSKTGQCFLVKKGVAQATIGRLLRAEVDAKIDTIAVIADYFGVSPSMMLELIKTVIRRVKRRAADPAGAELDADTAAAGPEPKKRRRNSP